MKLREAIFIYTASVMTCGIVIATMILHRYMGL